MNTIVVDSNEEQLNSTEHVLNGAESIRQINSFINPYDALRFAERNIVDLAFIEVDMPEMTGIELAHRLRFTNTDIFVVFVTAYEQYALSAFGVGAMGYVLKPYQPDTLLAEVKKADKLFQRHPSNRTVFIRTFGRFDVFVDDQLVVFNSAKAKEFLAILTDRKGGSVSMDSAISILWEDQPYDTRTKSNYRKILMKLRETLRTYGIERILGSCRGMCFLDTAKVKCDYYQFLDGQEKAREAFHDQYMFDYDWAETTLAFLLSKNSEIPEH